MGRTLEQRVATMFAAGSVDDVTVSQREGVNLAPNLHHWPMVVVRFNCTGMEATFRGDAALKLLEMGDEDGRELHERLDAKPQWWVNGTPPPKDEP